mmetsp:Transcript_130064/g.296549  ORF Transcript_130064/g.296549 Transcript_130064/m.296549 type:complete len:106 (-) Transcript_130064:38-355(-)
MPTNKGVSILLLTWNSSGRSQRNMHLQLPFQPSCQVHHSAQEYYFFFVVFSCCQNKKPPTELLFKIFSFDYAHLTELLPSSQPCQIESRLSGIIVQLEEDPLLFF